MVPVFILAALGVFLIVLPFTLPYARVLIDYMTSVNGFMTIASVLLSVLALMTVLSLLKNAVSRRPSYKKMRIRQRFKDF